MKQRLGLSKEEIERDAAEELRKLKNRWKVRSFRRKGKSTTE